MNVILNLKETKKLENNDIIVCQNGTWTNVSKEEFLYNYTKKVKELENQVNQLGTKYNELVEKINDKLEKYHNILQRITKED